MVVSTHLVGCVGGVAHHADGMLEGLAHLWGELPALEVTNGRRIETSLLRLIVRSSLEPAIEVHLELGHGGGNVDLDLGVKAGRLLVEAKGCGAFKGS